MKLHLCGSAALGLLLAACSGGEGGETNNAVVERATALQPGEYEITSTVETMRSTDNTTPATQSAEGGPPSTTRACVGPENAIAPAAFVEAGEECTVQNSYVRNGRINIQLRCNRSGKGGVTHTVDGEFQADSFSGRVITSTFFSGSGDYDLTRSFTAKRVGECTAAAG